jgi:hypothetical protein
MAKVFSEDGNHAFLQKKIILVVKLTGANAFRMVKMTSHAHAAQNVPNCRKAKHLPKTRYSVHDKGLRPLLQHAQRDQV